MDDGVQPSMQRDRDRDIDLNKLFTSEELELFRRHMVDRVDEVDPTTSAEKKARQMLHLLVTAEGKRNTTGELHLSRSTVLPMLIEALVGDEPDADVWIEALARGSFNLSNFARFLDPDAKMGTPGMKLPRLLGRYERALGGRNPKEQGRASDLGTALRLLITDMLIKELRRAVSPSAAMGSAWPLMRAVRMRGDEEVRRLLTDFGGDNAFLNHIRQHIREATYGWADRKNVKRSRSTNEQVDTRPPPGVDVAGYFARGRDADSRREDALVEFGRLILGDVYDADDVSRRALERVAQDVPRYMEVQALIEPRTFAMLSYLDRMPEQLSEDAAHHQHLQFLMPMLAEGVDGERVMAGAVAALHLADVDTPSDVTGLSLADAALGRVQQLIFRYARDTGPPPPDTPLSHIAAFQSSACYLSLAPVWPARKAWTRAGLVLKQPDPTLFGLLDSMRNGLRHHSTVQTFDNILYVPF